MDKIEEAVRSIKVLANTIEGSLSWARAEDSCLSEEDKQDIRDCANAIQTETERILRKVQE